MFAPSDFVVEYHGSAHQISGQSVPSGWIVFNEATGYYLRAGTGAIRTFNTELDAKTAAVAESILSGMAPGTDPLDGMAAA